MPLIIFRMDLRVCTKDMNCMTKSMNTHQNLFILKVILAKSITSGVKNLNKIFFDF